jgi:hypothetical protein
MAFKLDFTNNDLILAQANFTLIRGQDWVKSIIGSSNFTKYRQGKPDTVG